MAPEVLTLRQLNRATLARQGLLAREPLEAAAAVDRFGGLQAQDPKPPFAGLWSRVEGFRREDLHAALHAREVVRGTAMRGTLHLVGATDYLGFRAALQSVLTAGMRALGDRAAGLDLAVVLPAARELLEERPRTFNELRADLVRRFPAVNERALGFAVRMQLPLVMVPTEHPWGFPSVADFALAELWLGAPLPPDPGPEALIRRCLAAFGPCTVADVQAWSGLGGLRGAFDALRDELLVLADERGRELFDLPGAPRPEADVPAPARLLPEFDSLVLAHADRARVLADEHKGRVVTRNLRVKATFLWDGMVAGTWALAKARGTATLRLEPFGKLPRGAAKALTAEAEALLAFAEPAASGYAVEVGAPA
jgi:hypothetical protein